MSKYSATRNPRIDHINSPQIPEIPPLSHAVKYQDLIFISGQVGLSANGTQPESFEEEVRNALQSLDAVLESAGSNRSHLLKVTCYLGDIEDRDDFNKLYMEHFADPRPTRTTIQAGLAHGLRFEVDAVAAAADL